MLALTLIGLFMGACFGGMALLRDLQANTVSFLVLYALACAGFGPAVWVSHHSRPRRATLPLIVGLAVLFRLALLFTTPPTLSGDVYRYIWDGRLINAGVSPYAHAVNSPLLDLFDSPQRELVNNNWMASPYLPAAQALFAVVYRLAPDSALAFQVTAMICDLLTGWLVVDLLRRLGLPRERSLIYLWHPLVVVEFAHGAHVDAWMICLTMAALWALIVLRSSHLSAVALAAATLTKGLPVLLLPVLARRWRRPAVFLYAGLIAVALLPFGFAAGWGMSVPPNGEGLFGALLIYGAYWNYNSGLYHWLEVLFSGYPTPNPVPQEVVGWLPIYLAKAVMALGLGGTLLVVWRKSRRLDTWRGLLRLAVVPLAAYLLVATTVHPWYATWIVPLLPFLGQVAARHGDAAATTSLDAAATISLDAAATTALDAADTASQQPRASTVEGTSLCPAPSRQHFWALLYFSLVVPLSYLSYLDPAGTREYALVRAIEYVPVFLLLLWAVYESPRGNGRQAPERLQGDRQTCDPH
jgi:alpha-1,6-mannosyltransferase